MVISKREHKWRGFGIFGESRIGKTPLGFAFARILFINGESTIKIFDDCFELEEDKIWQCRCWGSRDELGEKYYHDLVDTMQAAGKSIEEVYPKNEKFFIEDATIWLLRVARAQNNVHRYS